MLIWGKSPANCGRAVLLMAVLLVASACASSDPVGPTLSEPKVSTAKRPQGEKSRSGPAKTTATKAAIDPAQAQIRALAKQAAPDDPDEQARLVRDFMEWSKARQKQ